MPNYAFVTSMPVIPGELGGLAGADSMCETLAHAAGLDGRYIAWLSSSTDNAGSRLQETNPRGWVRPDGKPFADTVNDIVHAKIWYPLRLTEHGVDLAISGNASDLVVATGTGPDGTAVPGQMCLDFKQQAGNVVIGAADAGAFDWTASNVQSCTEPARLLCFGTDRNVPVTVLPESSRLAFVGAEDLLVGAGLASFDASCQMEATAANLPGSFRAAVATSAGSALARFAAGPPWVRRDHVTVIGADLTSEAPILLQANGTADAVLQYVFAGADTLTTTATNAAATCNDWRTLSAATVKTGGSSRSGVWAFGGFTTSCNVAERVYCLQD